MKNNRKYYRKRPATHSTDPLEGMANLFDVAMVFAVGLMVSLVNVYRLHDFLDPNTDMTIVKNPDQPDKMEIITKKGKEIKVEKLDKKQAEGLGTRLGTAFRLQDGRVVYIPNTEGGE
jgi:hypothetical protein